MRGFLDRLVLGAGVLALLVGCGSSSPPNFAGDYTLAITNGANGCNFANWTEGSSAQGIPFTITQSGANLTGAVGGVTAAYLNFVLGSSTFTGTADGSSATLTLFGTRSMSQGNCTYTINATAHAGLMGDVLQGTIDYTTATNGSPDCGALAGCHSTQQFNGTRPPTSGGGG